MVWGPRAATHDTYEEGSSQIFLARSHELTSVDQGCEVNFVSAYSHSEPLSHDSRLCPHRFLCNEDGIRRGKCLTPSYKLASYSGMCPLRLYCMHFSMRSWVSSLIYTNRSHSGPSKSLTNIQNQASVRY